MSEETTKGFWDEAEVIYAYTRAQAIEDGVLVDVSSVAKEAGIKFPVAMTSTVWGEYVEVPEGVSCQDETGRLWDILWMFRCNGRRFEAATPCFSNSTSETTTASGWTSRDLVTLKAICGPGDTPEPVITIMLPDED